jgi:hypothetical protein
MTTMHMLRIDAVPKSFCSDCYLLVDPNLLAVDTICGRFLTDMATVSLSRRFGTTANGVFGMFPAYADEGDTVVPLSMADVPFVLRRCEDRRWLLIGDVFLNRVIETWIIKDILLGHHRRVRVLFDIQ